MPPESVFFLSKKGSFYHKNTSSDKLSMLPGECIYVGSLIHYLFAAVIFVILRHSFQDKAVCIKGRVSVYVCSIQEELAALFFKRNFLAGSSFSLTLFMSSVAVRVYAQGQNGRSIVEIKSISDIIFGSVFHISFKIGFDNIGFINALSMHPEPSAISRSEATAPAGSSPSGCGARFSQVAALETMSKRRWTSCLPDLK